MYRHLDVMITVRSNSSNRPPGRLPLLWVDPKDPVPLHVQVHKALRRFIELPKCQQGGLLPDELSLAAQLGVSRGTLRMAIGRLVQEGVLERRAGVGTRVARRKAESGITSWRSFTREMARRGIAVQTFHSEYRQLPASVDAVRALELKRSTPLWRLDRLRGWDNRPVLHSSSWFHPRLGLTGREDFTKPLYEVIESETGAVAHNAREEFLAVGADARMAELLKVKRGTPLLLRRHIVFDRGNRPIEFAEVRYLSSRFTLTLDLRRET